MSKKRLTPIGNISTDKSENAQFLAIFDQFPRLKFIVIATLTLAIHASTLSVMGEYFEDLTQKSDIERLENDGYFLHLLSLEVEEGLITQEEAEKVKREFYKNLENIKKESNGNVFKTLHAVSNLMGRYHPTARDISGLILDLRNANNNNFKGQGIGNCEARAKTAFAYLEALNSKKIGIEELYFQFFQTHVRLIVKIKGELYHLENAAGPTKITKNDLEKTVLKDVKFSISESMEKKIAFQKYSVDYKEIDESVTKVQSVTSLFKYVSIQADELKKYNESDDPLKEGDKIVTKEYRGVFNEKGKLIKNSNSEIIAQDNKEDNKENEKTETAPSSHYHKKPLVYLIVENLAIKKLIANLENMPVQEREKLAETNEDLEVLNALALDKEITVRRSLAKNKAINKQIVKTIFDKDDMELIENLISYEAPGHILYMAENISENAAKTLVNHNDYTHRAVAALHRKLDYESMLKLSEDEAYRVRAALSFNPNLPLDLALKLSKDKTEDVRALIAYTNTIPEILIALADDPSENVHLNLLINDKTPSEVIDKLLQKYSNDAKFRKKVAKEPFSSPETLRKLFLSLSTSDDLTDEEYRHLSDYILWNQNTPEDIKIQICNTTKARFEGTDFIENHQICGPLFKK